MPSCLPDYPRFIIWPRPSWRRQMPPEQAQVIIYCLYQSRLPGQKVHRTDTAISQAARSPGHVIINVPGDEHRPALFLPGDITQTILNSLPVSPEFFCCFLFHSKCLLACKCCCCPSFSIEPLYASIRGISSFFMNPTVTKSKKSRLYKG